METLPMIRDIQSLQTVADMMVRSGFFKDMRDMAKAFVVIKAGEEMGIPPVASMRQIELVNGQINIRSHLMAAMIKRTGRYNYRVAENTAERCAIDFYENGELIGTSEYTIDDAKLAKLAGKDQYTKQPKVMLYNRAMSQGARMFCPDIFLGAIYSEGEIEQVDVTPTQPDPRGNAVIDVDPVPDQGPVYDPEPRGKPEPASDAQMGMLMGILSSAGVKAGLKRQLVERVHPDGISKREASDAISLLKDAERLMGDWARLYSQMICEERGIAPKEAGAWMRENFGTVRLNDLTREQQQALFAWIEDDIPDTVVPEPENKPEPVQFDQGWKKHPDSPIVFGGMEPPAPTGQDWTKLIQSICMPMGLSVTTLSDWAIDRFAPESGVRDMSDLGTDVYNQIKAMTHEEVKESIMMQTEQQGELI